MIIRKKEKKDCESWVDVNIKSWNENLKGVVSDKILDYIKEKRESRIKNDLENFKSDDWHYVLEENEKVIGIMKLKESTMKGYENCGEIQVLYLYTEEKGKGYGKALLKKGLDVLKRKGYKKAVIGCLVGNPSNGFYKHMGGTLVRQDPWNFLEEHYMENIYEYDLI